MYRGSQFFDKFRLHFTQKRIEQLLNTYFPDFKTKHPFSLFNINKLRLCEIGPDKKGELVEYFASQNHDVSWLTENMPWHLTYTQDELWEKLGHIKIFQSQYHFVYAIHVIEHFDTELTSQYFKTIHYILKPDGIFYAITPNINSLPAKIFGKHWWFRLDSTHKQYFYPAKIAKMLHEAGFEHIKVKFPLMDSISSDITSILGCLPHKKPILNYFLVKITCICAIPLVILARLLFPSLRPTMEVVAQKERFPYADENFI